MSPSLLNKDLWSAALKLTELASKLIVIAVPALYFVGWAYAEAFWLVYGTADDVLSYTTQELLRMGGIVVLNSSIYMIAVVTLCAAAVVMTVFLLDAAKDVIVAHALRFIEKRRAHPRDDPSENPELSEEHKSAAASFTKWLQLAGGIAAELMVMALVFIVLLMAGIRPATSSGDAEGRKGVQLLQNYLTGEQRWTLAYLSNPEQPRILIRCSNEACALYSGTSIEVVARSEIERMVPCSKVDRLENGNLTCGIPFTGLLPIDHGE